jgi:hypothetical protein
MLIFGLSKIGLPYMYSVALLEADFGSPTTYFRFGCPYGSPVGDILEMPCFLEPCEYLGIWHGFGVKNKREEY